MLKSKISLLILLMFSCFQASWAQRQSDLVINEVLTLNENNYMDRFGSKAGWIEIYNKSAGTVNLAGCYITDDPSNLRKYPFVKGDLRMQIRPHQRVVVYCNSETEHSVLHTNFTLKPNQENYIALVSANGIDIIDEVTVPALAADRSWGAPKDGDKANRQTLKKATPDAPNYVYMGATAAEVFKEKDPYGVGMALTAMSVVFSALLCLYLSFKIIGKIAIKLTSTRARKAAGLPKGTKVEHNPDGEVYAAIAMALNLHEENAHDEEDTILTIRHIEKRYSPWSSKIYTLRETPEKRKM